MNPTKHPNKAIRHAHRNRQFWTDVDEVLNAAESQGLRSIDIFTLRQLQTRSLGVRLEYDHRSPARGDQTYDGYDVVMDRADQDGI